VTEFQASVVGGDMNAHWESFWHGLVITDY
jgi:hypothetical protein